MLSTASLSLEEQWEAGDDEVPPPLLHESHVQGIYSPAAGLAVRPIGGAAQAAGASPGSSQFGSGSGGWRGGLPAGAGWCRLVQAGAGCFWGCRVRCLEVLGGAGRLRWETADGGSWEGGGPRMPEWE